MGFLTFCPQDGWTARDLQCQERLLQACAADDHVPGRLAQRLHDGCGAVTVMVEEEICSNGAVVGKGGSKLSLQAAGTRALPERLIFRSGAPPLGLACQLRVKLLVRRGLGHFFLLSFSTSAQRGTVAYYCDRQHFVLKSFLSLGSFMLGGRPKLPPVSTALDSQRDRAVRKVRETFISSLIHPCITIIQWPNDFLGSGCRSQARPYLQIARNFLSS